MLLLRLYFFMLVATRYRSSGYLPCCFLYNIQPGWKLLLYYLKNCICIADIIWANKLAYGIRNLPTSHKRTGNQSGCSYKLCFECCRHLCILAIKGFRLFTFSFISSLNITWSFLTLSDCCWSLYLILLQEFLGADNLFLLFGAISLVSLLFIIFYVPETKGLSLEEIESKILN